VVLAAGSKELLKWLVVPAITEVIPVGGLVSEVPIALERFEGLVSLLVGELGSPGAA
jgi:hypothetical protein